MKKLSVPYAKSWKEHYPEPALEDNEVTIL